MNSKHAAGTNPGARKVVNARGESGVTGWVKVVVVVCWHGRELGEWRKGAPGGAGSRCCVGRVLGGVTCCGASPVAHNVQVGEQRGGGNRQAVADNRVVQTVLAPVCPPLR